MIRHGGKAARHRRRQRRRRGSRSHFGHRLGFVHGHVCWCRRWRRRPLPGKHAVGKQRLPLGVDSLLNRRIRRKQTHHATASPTAATTTIAHATIAAKAAPLSPCLGFPGMGVGPSAPACAAHATNTAPVHLCIRGDAHRRGARLRVRMVWGTAATRPSATAVEAVVVMSAKGPSGAPRV